MHTSCPSGGDARVDRDCVRKGSLEHGERSEVPEGRRVKCFCGVSVMLRQ